MQSEVGSLGLMNPSKGDCLAIDGIGLLPKSADLLSGSNNGSSVLSQNTLQEAPVLNTYFLSASSASWEVIDKDRSLYQLTIPLSAAAEWIPVLTPHKNGTHHVAVSSERLLLDWAVLDEDAKILGPDFYSIPAFAMESAQQGDWLPDVTINNLIQSGHVVPRYKSATTLMLEFSDNPYSAVGDVLSIRMAESMSDSKPTVRCKLHC